MRRAVLSLVCLCWSGSGLWAAAAAAADAPQGVTAPATPSDPRTVQRAPAFDPALAAMVEQETAKLGIKPKTALLPSDRALEAVTAIKRGDYAAAERIANDVLRHSTLQSWQFYPFNEFMGSIIRGGDNPALLSHLNAWVKEAPNSAIAYLVRAEYFESAGWIVRSDAVASRTPEPQLKMFSDDMDLAAADAKQSISLNPNIPWGYSLLLHTISGNANSSEMEEAFRSGIKANPAYYELYRMRLYSLTPKWGGSVDEMYKFVEKYAGGAAENSPLKLLYLHLYAYLFDAAQFKCQSLPRGNRSDCINTAMDQLVLPGLEEGVQKALHLYKASDPIQFNTALWPILGKMATSTAGGSTRFDALLQSAADMMGSDNRIMDEAGHNSFVLDDITAHVWANMGNMANADKKYREALSDVAHTAFAEEAQKDEAMVGVLHDMIDYADNTAQFMNILVYQKAANAVGGMNHSNAPYMGCYAYFKLKHFAEAVSECTRLIEGNGNYLQTHYWRARAYEGLAQWDAALADFGPIADSASTAFRTPAAIQMSVDFGQKSDFAGQLASMNQHAYLFDEASQAAEDLAVSYNNRCFAYMKLGQLQKALDDCTVSLKYGHIPDAVQKQRELIKQLGPKAVALDVAVPAQANATTRGGFLSDKLMVSGAVALGVISALGTYLYSTLLSRSKSNLVGFVLFLAWFVVFIIGGLFACSAVLNGHTDPGQKLSAHERHMRLATVLLWAGVIWLYVLLKWRLLSQRLNPVRSV